MGRIPIGDEHDRLELPGWPERFQDVGDVRYRRPVAEDDARWWCSVFVEPLGLYPDELAKLLTDGTPGKKSFVFEWIRASDESFGLSIESSEGNSRLWFHGSEMTIPSGDFKRAEFYQDRLDVDMDHRGRRYAQKIMRPIIEASKLLGVTRLTLDAQDIGGYLWAEAGAVPIGSWKEIQAAAIARLLRLQRRGEITPERVNQVGHMLEKGPEDPRMLLAIARLPDPVKSSQTRFPMDPEIITLGKELLIGVSWKGEFDLTRRWTRLALARWMGKS